MVKDHPPHKRQPNKCKTTIIKKRGRQKIICLCINPCQDIARRWLTSHVAAVTLLPSCDPWAGGCGSLQVRPRVSIKAEQHQGFCSYGIQRCLPASPHPPYAIFSFPALLSYWSLQEPSEWRSFIFFPQKYLLTGHRIFQKLQKLDMGGQVHMKRQKSHLPVYYSHKNPTKTLFLHEKKWVPAPWVSRFSVGVSSLLT